MADLADAAREFRDLARNLALVGLGELRQELYQAINDEVRPLGQEIASTGNLDPYMPNRYAEILAEDLAIQVSKLTGANTAGVQLRMRGRRRGRHVSRLNRGILSHPVFADSMKPRAEWTWVYQDIRPGFFTVPAEASAPRVREAILAAMRRIAEKATGK